MPESIEKLNQQSGQGQIQAAISECIAFAMSSEGLTQEQASGKCYGMARQSTGKPLGG